MNFSELFLCFFFSFGIFTNFYLSFNTTNVFKLSFRHESGKIKGARALIPQTEAGNIWGEGERASQTSKGSPMLGEGDG